MEAIRVCFLSLKKIEILLVVEQYQNQDHMYQSLLSEKTQNYLEYEEKELFISFHWC